MRDRRWWAVFGVMTLLVVAVVRIGVAALGAGHAPLGAEVDADRHRAEPRARLERPEFDSLVDVVRTAAPFQALRAPEGLAVVDGSAAPPTARPVLRLGGLAGGRIPLAVLYGIPGIEGGRLVQEGDTVGGLRIRAIRGGIVSVVGYDTTWVLSLEEASR